VSQNYVIKTFSEADTQPVRLSEIAKSLFIINDGSADLTIKAANGAGINVLTFKLRAGERFDEMVKPFDRVTIEGTGAKYRGICRNYDWRGERR